jgi:hypothetical protein
MNYREKAAILMRAARRASARTEYLGWLLARYRQIENCSEPELAKRLGVSTADFPRMALCLRPRSKHFAADVSEIAEKFGLDNSELAAVVRLVEAAEAIQALPPSARDAGLLMAARARKPNRKKGGSDAKKP